MAPVQPFLLKKLLKKKREKKNIEMGSILDQQSTALDSNVHWLWDGVLLKLIS